MDHNFLVASFPTKCGSRCGDDWCRKRYRSSSCVHLQQPRNNDTGGATTKETFPTTYFKFRGFYACFREDFSYQSSRPKQRQAFVRMYNVSLNVSLKTLGSVWLNNISVSTGCLYVVYRISSRDSYQKEKRKSKGNEIFRSYVFALL